MVTSLVRPSAPSLHQATFRRDINGLRAWAVASVVLFHLGVPGMAGGFAGVDAFFVISGYLMTGLLLKGLDAGHIGIGDFLLARARRILPALCLLCVALLGAGAQVLLPLDYKQLASHTLATLGFFSNLKYWSEAGYFDASSHEKWLLHSWSLSVEWQFYLLLPCLFWALWRLGGGRRALWATMGSLAAGSLALSVWLSLRDPTAAYYGLHSRAWEMLLGGLLHALPAWPAAPRHPAREAMLRRGLEAAGFALLLGCLLFINERWPWPGLPALLPTLGTAAVLIAGRQDSWFTAPRALQYLGSRSYSIYLWHWPACVLLNYLGLNGQTGPQLVALLAMLGLSEVSWRLAEQAGGRWMAAPRRQVAWRRIGGGVALPSVLALGLWLSQGWPGRFAPEAEAIAAMAEESPPRIRQCHLLNGVRSPLCQHGEGPPALVVLGDSHASVLIPAIQAALPRGRSLLQLTYSGCPYVQDARFHTPWASPTYDCPGFNRWARDTVQALPPDVAVVLASRYAYRGLGPNENGAEAQAPGIDFPASGPADPDRLGRFATQIVQDTCDLARQRPVWMVRPIPEIGQHVPKRMARRIALGQTAELSLPWTQYQARNRWVWQAQDEAHRRCGARIIDPTARLCTPQRCLSSLEGRPLYRDDNHLSEFGDHLLEPLFRDALRQPW